MITIVRRHFFRILALGLGNPLFYFTVFSLMQVDIWPGANPLFRSVGANQYPVTGAGLLVFLSCTLFLAVVFLRIEYGNFASWNGEAEGNFIRKNRKAMPFYAAGWLLSLFLISGTEGNLVGFVLFPLVLLHACVLYIRQMGSRS